MLHAAWLGFMSLWAPMSIAMMVIGVVVGFVFGATPGLGGNMYLAVLLPFVYKLSPPAAFALLLGGHSAITFGGAASAILINTPGTGDCISTTWDGYPLSQQGHAGRAIGAASTASALGGLFGVAVLIVVIPLVSRIISAFGPPEMLSMALVGIAMVGFISQGSLSKGLIAGGLGLLLSFIGTDPITGETRFTFGSLFLQDGLDFAVAIIGLFGIAGVLDLLISGRKSVAETDVPSSGDSTLSGIGDVLRNWRLLLQSSSLGALLGPIPGVGGSITNVMAYALAQRTSKVGHLFGTGRIEGVIAPQSADNSKEAGAIIPTVALGIPGSSAMAIFLGAFYILGLQPGPQMLTTHADITFSLVWILAVANVLTGILALAAGGQLVRITRMRTAYLATVVLVIAFVGAYSLTNSFDSVIAALAFGVVGVVMKRYGFSRPALLIGLLLGSTAETNFMVSYHVWGLAFLLRPITVIILLAGIAGLTYPTLKSAGGRLVGAARRSLGATRAVGATEGSDDGGSP